jgi:toxin-antitoxin system PIN domain toxin
MVYLLDANVLIALTVFEHEHHSRVSRWISTVDHVALCPIVEGALLRFLVRIGGTARAAQEVLRLMGNDPRCEFWPDSQPYADADLTSVRGYRQVTDAYLLALVRAREDCLLATLDEGLARDCPEFTLLLPRV